jgi:hypothetical protein
MSLVRSLRDNLKSLGKIVEFYCEDLFFVVGFVEEIEMIETEDDARQKRPATKKRTMDVLESTVS